MFVIDARDERCRWSAGREKYREIIRAGENILSSIMILILVNLLQLMSVMLGVGMVGLITTSQHTPMADGITDRAAGPSWCWNMC